MYTLNKNQINMSKGPIFSGMIRYTIPLVLTGILQLLYNAADIIVVGNFAEQGAVSAVSTNTHIINLIINVFLGLSIGINVTLGRFFGAKDDKEIHKTVHTSILIAIIIGFFLSVIGFFISRPLLEYMQSPPDVLDRATLYMQIYFIGMPFNIVYNFGGAVLRAIGDTKRPLKFLALSGVVNVILNLFFVVVLNLSVAGVAFATIISQGVSAFLVIRCLIKADDSTKLCLKSLKIHKDSLLSILKLGLPAGLQGSLFAFSNALIQSSINEFGSIVSDANGIASNLEGFLYVTVNCIQQTSTTYTSQNVGASKFGRVRKCLPYSYLIILLIIVPGSIVLTLFASEISMIYTQNAEIIAYTVERLTITIPLYFMCCVMDVNTGHLRGLGFSLSPMLIAVSGVVVFRILWISFIFPEFYSLQTLYLSYPISWFITISANLTLYFIVRKKVPSKDIC